MMKTCRDIEEREIKGTCKQCTKRENRELCGELK